MNVNDIHPGPELESVEPTHVGSMVVAIKIAVALLQLVYRLPDGILALLRRATAWQL